MEFYIKISQDRGLREKYYTISDAEGDKVVDDPYIEHLRDKLESRIRSMDNKQKTLDVFTAS